MFNQSKILIDDSLAENIIAQRKLTPIQRDSRGWQSRSYTDQPFSWFETVYQKVKKHEGAIASWWFNVNAPGEYTGWHAHHHWQKVAVLYVSVPSGNIEFRQDGSYWQETPQQGDLLVFPGDLEHRVSPNNSNEQRISVAFNFKHTQ